MGDGHPGAMHLSGHPWWGVTRGPLLTWRTWTLASPENAESIQTPFGFFR